MERLILVRYGQYENGHLTDEGKECMAMAAEGIKSLLGSTIPLVVTASIPRAIESAEIVASLLDAGNVEAYSELYAAEEDGLLPDCTTAADLIHTLGEKNPVIVAVVSREYIDTLPGYIFGVANANVPLKRGEALVLEYSSKKVLQIPLSRV